MVIRIREDSLTVPLTCTSNGKMFLGLATFKWKEEIEVYISKKTQRQHCKQRAGLIQISCLDVLEEFYCPIQ